MRKKKLGKPKGFKNKTSKVNKKSKDELRDYGVFGVWSDSTLKAQSYFDDFSLDLPNSIETKKEEIESRLKKLEKKKIFMMTIGGLIEVSEAVRELQIKINLYWSIRNRARELYTQGMR